MIIPYVAAAIPCLLFHLLVFPLPLWAYSAAGLIAFLVNFLVYPFSSAVWVWIAVTFGIVGGPKDGDS